MPASASDAGPVAGGERGQPRVATAQPQPDQRAHDGDHHEIQDRRGDERADDPRAAVPGEREQAQQQRVDDREQREGGRDHRAAQAPAQAPEPDESFLVSLHPPSVDPRWPAEPAAGVRWAHGRAA